MHVGGTELRVGGSGEAALLHRKKKARSGVVTPQPMSAINGTDDELCDILKLLLL